MDEHPVDNDSRLSLDQRFSGGVRRRPSRSRHQSLDRRFTRAATGNSQAASWSLGQRTIGADGKLPAAARSVCQPISVAPSAHCWSDESSKHSDNADESMEHWSLGRRTTGADHRLPTTISATVGTVDKEDPLLGTSPQGGPRGVNPESHWSLGQRTTGADHRPPTTTSTTVGTKDNSLPLPAAMTTTVNATEGNQAVHWSTGQRTNRVNRRLPSTISATVGSMDDIVVLEQDCYSKPCEFIDCDCCSLTTGLHRHRTAVEQQDNLVGPLLPTTASPSSGYWTRQASIALGQDCHGQARWICGDVDHLSTTGTRTRNMAVEQQDNLVGSQRPTTASTSSGQWTTQASVALGQDCHGHETTSSSSASTASYVNVWTSDGTQTLSTSASAGAQSRSTDKASRTNMDSETAAHDEEAGHNNTIGSTEPRSAALGGRTSYNEADDIAPPVTDLIEQRSGPPSAESASGESSTSHPCYANLDRPKAVDVSPQVVRTAAASKENRPPAGQTPPTASVLFAILTRVSVKCPTGSSISSRWI